MDNRRKYFDHLAEELGIDTQHQLYSLSAEDLHKGGTGLLQIYKGSVYKALQSVYPGSFKSCVLCSDVVIEYEWYPWLFETTVRGIWTNSQLHLKFLDWLAEELGIETQEDWLDVSVEDIQQHGGSSLLYIYGESVIKVVSVNYPQFDWKQSVMNRKVNISEYNKHLKKSRPIQEDPLFYDIETQKRMFDEMEKKLHIRKLEDWYEQDSTKVRKNGGRWLLKRYKTLCNLLSTFRPQHEWLPWVFQKVPEWNFWKNKKNHRRYLDWLAKDMNFTEMDDWYSIKQEDIVKRRGKTLLYMYKGALFNILSSNYPEHDWNPFKFTRVPNGFWEDAQNVKWFMKYAAKRFEITRDEDWAFMTYEHFSQLPGAITLLNRFKGVQNLLMIAFPERDWTKIFNEASTVPSYLKAQITLKRVLRDIFVTPTQKEFLLNA